MRRRGRATPGRRIALAAIASLALHALVMGVPWCAPAPVTERTVTEIVLAPVEEEAEEPALAEAPPEPAEAPPQVDETPPEPAETPPQRAEAPPEPAEAPSQRAEAPPEPAEAPPQRAEAPPEPAEAPPQRAEAPPEPAEAPPQRAEAPPEPAEAPPQRAEAPPPGEPGAPAGEAPETAPEDGAPAVDLFPEEALARAAGPVPGEPTDERARISARIHTYVTDAKAHERVDAGLVDPYFTDLREQFERSFDPVWADLDGSSDEGVVGTVEAWARDYAATADRYARTGSPYREGEQASDLTHAADRPDGIGPTARMGQGDSQADLMLQQQLHDLWRDMIAGKAGGIQLLALVRVVQAPDGQLLKVEVVRTSGRDAYDEMVRRSVRDALSDGSVPERQGSGLGLTGDRIVSVWAFQTSFVVVPPVPIAGCELNADLSVGECYHPFKKVVRSHLELQAVY